MIIPLLLTFFIHFVAGAFDLTLSEGANGTAVVDACIAKLSNGFSFLPYDEQLLRRIAYTETRDGLDATNGGGIWQLSPSQYQQTKTVLDETTNILPLVSINFGIDWSTTIESDLQKPFYSVLGARLYMEVLGTSIPLSINTSGQATFYANQYTSTGGSIEEFESAIDAIANIEVCRVDSLDIVFILDFSSSVGDDFQKMLAFVINVTNTFNIGEDGVRVGVVSYSNEANVEFHLNALYSKSTLESAINSLSYSSTRFTRTYSALTAARTISFTEGNGVRPLSQGVPRIAIVVTDGKSENTQSTIEEARNLREAGIIGFAVGIAEAREEELNEIASRSTYSTYANMFQSLEFANTYVKLSKDICVASPDLSINDVVIDTIATGEVKYLNYPLPSDKSGITIKLNVSSGYCVLYASSLVQTPNEAIYDLKLMTRGWADGFIDHETLANAESANRMYIVIRSIEATMMEVSAEHGDTSTIPVSIILTPSTTLVGYRGSQTTATAYVIGRPLPSSVQWYRPDGSLITDSQADISIDQRTINTTTIRSELTLSGLTTSHTGLYRCYGYNVLPDSSRAEFNINLNLTVREFMAINFMGVVIDSTSISLSWDVPSVPNVNIIITYFRIDILEIETSRKWSITTSATSTLIMSLHPYFMYTCALFTVGSNTTYSTDTIVTLRTLQSVPTLPPESVSGVINSSSTLNLTWMPPPFDGQNGIIEYYIIRMLEVETSNRLEFTSNTTYYVLTSLHPYYEYTFQVAAVTTSNGPFSDEYTIRMPEDVPTGTPSNFSAVITSYTSTKVTITFIWSPPRNDLINGIILYYSLTCTTGVSVNELKINVTGTTFIYENVDVGNHYTCSVCAFTQLGCGPNAIIFIFTNQPGFIQTTTTATTITLDWTSPFRNSEVVQYQILYQITETSFDITTPNAVVVINTQSTEVEYVIQMLLPATTYRIEVKAILTDGSQGAIGDEVTTKTKTEDDYTVQDYRCVSTSTDSILCTWGIPSPLPDGYTVKEYQIAYRFADGFNYFPGYGTELSRSVLSSTTTRYTIDGLEVYTGYVIELTCVMNLSGSNDIVSTTTVFTITESDFVNGTIQDFMLSINSSEIIWRPPARINWNGNILSYDIVYERKLITSSGDEYSFTHNIMVSPQTNNPNPSLATDPLQWERYGVSERFEENFEYKFIFIIVNSKGAGSPYEIIEPIKESVPTGPPIDIGVESVTRTSLVIVWSPPDPIDANGVIVLYSLIIVRVDLKYTITTEVPGNQLSYGLEGLFSYENISVTIAARTAVGWGPYSNIQYFTTLGNYPGPPLDLVGTFTSNTSVLLTWNRPSITNGVILGYEIIYEGHNQRIEDTPDTGPYTLTTAQTEMSITRLFIGYYYVFQVRALNNAGYGQSSRLVMYIPDIFNMGPGGAIGRKDNTEELILIILLAILCAILLCIILILCIVLCWKCCCKKKKKERQYSVPSINGSIDSARLRTVTLNSADFYGRYNVEGGSTLDKEVILIGEGNDSCPCEEDTPAHQETTLIYEKCDSARSSPNIAIGEVHVHTNGPHLHHHDNCEYDDKPSPRDSITITADIDGGGFHPYNECDNILINTGDTDVHIHTVEGEMKSHEICSIDPPVIITTTMDGHDHSQEYICDQSAVSITRDKSPYDTSRSPVKSYSLPRTARPMKVSRENVALGTTTRRVQTLQTPRSNYTFTRSSENVVGRSQSMRERPMYSVTRIRSSDNLPSVISPAKQTTAVLSGKTASPTQVRRVKVQEDFELNSLTLSNRGGRIEKDELRRAYSMKAPSGPKKYGRSQYV